MIKVSAPGKLMLFGEHSVVHHRPCIVTAVDRRMSATLEKRNDDKIVLNAPDVDILNYVVSKESLDSNHPKHAKFVIRALFNFFEKYNIKGGTNIETKSEFTNKLGLGSSSSVTVCAIKGLSTLFEIDMNNEELFDLCYKTVIDVQGVGSGFDIAAAIYGGTLLFDLKGRIFQPIKIDDLLLIVGYTGIKADTATLVKMVRENLNQNPEKINTIFDEITKIVNLAKTELENANWKRVGELMNENQRLLRQLNVSSEKLETLIRVSLETGAYGSKLSGAGKGDCMISIADQNTDKIRQAIEDAGGQPLNIRLQAQGVRIE